MQDIMSKSTHILVFSIAVNSHILETAILLFMELSILRG